MAPVICVPTKELKNTQSFTATVQEAEGPVIVTKNGKEAFVSMSLDCYDALVREGARARLYESIDRTFCLLDSRREARAPGRVSMNPSIGRRRISPLAD